MATVVVAVIGVVAVVRVVAVGPPVAARTGIAGVTVAVANAPVARSPARGRRAHHGAGGQRVDAGDEAQGGEAGQHRQRAEEADGRWSGTARAEHVATDRADGRPRWRSAGCSVGWCTGSSGDRGVGGRRHLRPDAGTARQ
ncbi:MAG: hypothetical protein R2755_04080 [Acidimicrobiales bacterium]